MKKVILATLNPGKIREFTALQSLFELVPQSDFKIPAIEETGLTFVENALIKARHASKLSGFPAIADDSGICVDALNGQPGLHSARFAGENATREQRNQKLLDLLKDIPEAKRTARLHSTLVYLNSFDDPNPVIAQGNLEGRILFEPEGSGGFGYEPIFYLLDRQCCFGEMPLEEKVKISHRGIALQKLIAALL
ncbi:MAG TPA: RdgB/HAM1 family non-canonical purine NTP pyrophosphatase [Gammaproteobacteria bacterium]|nr:RdgB/HAM1 family non-canonical purine NTP pyrophosphatase [Gammaproteobacteria bacterium]